MDPTTMLKILSFRNCDLYCCHLDGYKKDREGFLHRMNDVERYFTDKPADARFRIWYNVDETQLDEALLNEIVDSVMRIRNHIVKLAIIGLRGRKQRYLIKRLKAATGERPFPYAFFDDAEMAKEWLI